MYDVFISYSKEDKEVVNSITNLLKESDFKPFTYEREIKTGDDFDKKVRDALQQCIVVIVIISPSSLSSNWVAYEIGYASALNKRILPFLVHKGLEKQLKNGHEYISRLQYAKDLDDLKKTFSSIGKIRSDLYKKAIRGSDYRQQYLEWWDNQNKTRGDSLVSFAGHKFIVHGSVFSPDYSMTFSSHLASTALHGIMHKRVLDIGCGCGCLSIISIQRKAKFVLATDIDEDALINSKENLERFNLTRTKKIKLLRADLFDSLEEGKTIGKFHVIVANLPIAFKATTWNHLNIDFSQIYRRFSSQLSKHLLPGGKAYITWASFGDEKMLEEIFIENNLLYKTKENVAFGITWILYEVRPKYSNKNLFKGEKKSSR